MPGSMLPLNTTTMGDSLPVTSINVFQMMSAAVAMSPMEDVVSAVDVVLKRTEIGTLVEELTHVHVS